MSHPYHEMLEKIITTIVDQLKERDVKVNRDFITFVVHLLIRDMRIGLKEAELKSPSQCVLMAFIDGIVSGYLNPTDTTMANLRMSWIMKMGHGIKLSYVQEQYELKFQHQLKLMTQDILQYPETCSKVQLDQLFSKMQVFIASSYHLGCPKNDVLLKLTAQALHSVIGRSDLQNYVLKKKYHRQEYLQRLASTVAGIVIYNSDGPDGDRENVRSGEFANFTDCFISHLHSVCRSHQRSGNGAKEHKRRVRKSSEASTESCRTLPSSHRREVAVQ